MRNQFLMRAVVALDVNATNVALSTLRADRTFQPMPSGMNPLHVILAHVPQNAAELTRIIQITKMLLLHSPSGYIDRATSSRCPRSGGVTPLMLVVQNRRLELARVLLAMRPDMKLRETEEHLTGVYSAPCCDVLSVHRVRRNPRPASLWCGRDARRNDVACMCQC